MRTINPLAMLGLAMIAGAAWWFHHGAAGWVMFGLGYAAAFFGECIFRVRARPRSSDG